MTEYKTPKVGGVNIALQKPIPADVKAKVIALRAQGFSGSKIAQETGLTPASVYRILRRHKVGVEAAALNLEVGTKRWRKQELARLYTLVANERSRRDPLDIIDAFRREEEGEHNQEPSQAYKSLVEAMLALAAIPDGRKTRLLAEADYTIIPEPLDTRE